MSIFSINELHERLKEGNASPVSILEEISKRVEKYDGKIKSYITLNQESFKFAEESERRIKAGEHLRLLEGIPLSVKDLMDTAGLRTTYGNSYYFNNIPEKNASIINNLLNAGAYVFGKTNTHEFGLGSRTEPTANPYDLKRIPGGSSGGSAAAIASGMGILATGSDSGGSIRIPASMCGVTGFMPTLGSLPTEGIFTESWTMDNPGPILKFSSDIPVVMEAMGKKIKIPKKLKHGKVGLISTALNSSAEGVQREVRHALDILEATDVIEIVEVNSPVLKKSRKFHEIIDLTELAVVHRENYMRRREIYLKASIAQIEEGMNLLAIQYADAQHHRDSLYSDFLSEMKGLDALVLPTLSHIAPRSDGSDRDEQQGESFLEEFNYLGLPAISVPCGFHRNMPVGLQFASRHQEDGNVIFLGNLFQKETDWHLKEPF